MYVRHLVVHESVRLMAHENYRSAATKPIAEVSYASHKKVECS